MLDVERCSKKLTKHGQTPLNYSANKKTPKLRSKIINSFGWLLFDKIYKSLLGVTVFVYIARKLGPEVFGVIALAQGTLAVITTISGFGLDSLLVRDFAVHPGRMMDDRIISVVTIRLITSFLAYILAVVYSWWAVADAESFIISGLIFSSVFYTPFSLFYAKHQADGSFNRIVISQAIALLVCNAVKLVVVQQGLPLYWLAIGIHLEVLVSGGLLFYQCPALHHVKLKFPPWPIVKNYLDQGVPLLISGLAIILYMRIDQFMLADMSTSEQVGQYSVAVKFTEIWYFIPLAVSAVLLPSLSSLRARDPNQFTRMIDELNKIICAVGWIIVASISVGAYFILPLILGPKYATAVNVVLVYQFSLLFVFMGVVRSQYFVIEGRTNLEMIATLLGLFTNILLNLFLIPRYGAIGASIATVVSYGISAYFSTCFFPSVRDYAAIQTRSIFSIFSPLTTFKILTRLYSDKTKIAAN